MKKTMKTNILCRKTHQYHRVTLHADGRCESTGCGDVGVKAEKAAALIRMGGKVTVTDCVGLVALVRYGIPHILNRAPNADGYISLGNWNDLYTRFENNKVVEAAMDETRRLRDKPHARTFSKARAHLRKCKSYGRKFQGDMAEVVQFVPEQGMANGKRIATDVDAIWTVPLQKGWFGSVFEAGIAIVSSRFICGISQDGRTVFAIDKDDNDHIVLREYGLQTKPHPKLVRL